MKKLGRFAFRHKFIVIAVWLIAFIAITGISQSLGSKFNDSFSLPGTDSTKAYALLNKALPKQSGDSAQVVFHVNSGTINDPAVVSAMSKVFTSASSIPSVGAVQSPYDPMNRSQVSPDGKTAYATVVFSKFGRALPDADLRALVKDGEAARSANLQVEFGGNAIAALNAPKGSPGEMIGIIAAGIILFVSFGSVVDFYFRFKADFLQKLFDCLFYDFQVFFIHTVWHI